MNSINKRIEWIDVAKCIGIFFIVLGHVLTTGVLRRWIYAFHVPLFFFLSGLTFSPGKSFHDFILKKIKSLVVPYLIFSLISMSLFALLAKFIVTEGTGELTLRKIEIMLYGNSRPDIMKWNTPLWFLPCLFGVQLMTYAIEMLKIKLGREKNISFQIIVIVLFFASGIGLNKAVDFRLPLQLESGILMVGFFELGVICLQCGWVNEIEKISYMKAVIGVILCAVIGCIASNANGFCEVRIYTYGKYPILFLVSALFLGISVVLTAVMLRKNKLLQVCGRSTLVILCLHKFPVVFFQSFCPGVKDLLKKPETLIGIATACGVSVLIILMCYVVKILIDLCLSCAFSCKSI